MRGKLDVEDLKMEIIIDYKVYTLPKLTNLLNEKIAQLARDKKIDGIRDIRDESNREGIRVVN